MNGYFTHFKVLCLSKIFIKIRSTLFRDGRKDYEGEINTVSIVALYSGVCKVNAAIATQLLIDTYDIHSIINIGTVGGIDEGVE